LGFRHDHADIIQAMRDQNRSRCALEMAERRPFD
jgi:hypothetical protein